MGNEEKILSRLSALGLTIHELLRYGYGGLLTYVIAFLVAPTTTERVVKTLGTPINILLAFAVGGAIYVGHRQVVGELLYLLHERVHIWLSRRSSRHGGGCTCRTAYFVDRFDLSLTSATEAFRTVRDSKFYDQTRQHRFHRQHSELHMLYITFFVLTIGAIVLWAGKSTDAIVKPLSLVIVALFALLSGFVGNILLCRQECKVLLLIPEDIIRELLITTEFINQEDK